MSPIQQMLLGVGAVATKTYIDDIFSTYLWKGTGSDQTINTGLDMAGEGGMVWVKNRSSSVNHAIVDTVRGAGKYIESNTTDAEDTYSISDPNARNINSFTSTGFTLKSDDGNQYFNWPTGDPKYSSWSFRRASGFFDIVTYTGTGSARTVDHNLGCIPGMIIIKRLDTADNWNVYHRNQHGSNSPGYYLQLNTTDSIGGASNRWNDTAPTATEFTVGTAPVVNANGDDFIAYLFAGGESNASEARSVDFDGSNDGLSATSNDLIVGTGDFTAECWFKYEGGNTDRIISMDKTSNPTNKWLIYHHNGSIRLNINGSDVIFMGADNGFDTNNTDNWYHLALVRSNNVIKLYLNGIADPTTVSDSLDYQSDQIHIGMNPSGTENFDGLISNVRVVAGTAVYTSSFRPPTKPLENITNTKILCCNNSSITGKTVGPTITATDSPTASTDSPFDDPAGFVFGDAGDQNVIKCGSYVGNGSSTGPEINLGWEPQWLLIKNADGGSNWRIVDSMRGIVTGYNDAFLTPDLNEAEFSFNKIDLTPTGFKITAGNGDVNENNDKIIYVAIRRPDGYVGKLPELGTGVFAMDTGNSSSTIPTFDSGFPVDFGLARQFASTDSWLTSSRLIGGKYLKTNSTDAESSNTHLVWDSNNGFWKELQNTYQAWMWKRHAGFDVVTYKGNATSGLQVSHSLGKIPEMIWVKRRSGSWGWQVYHKGLNGGTNPEQKYLELNDNAAEVDNVNRWNDTAPTSTHFTLGNYNAVNGGGDNTIAMLFASVDGISKVGYYNGTGSSGHSITTGFQPRFIVIKAAHRADGYGGGWHEFDTLRGINSGNEYPLTLNSDAAESAMNHLDYIDLDSDGFTIQSTSLSFNGSNARYIYYAHA